MKNVIKPSKLKNIKNLKLEIENCKKAPALMLQILNKISMEKNNQKLCHMCPTWYKGVHNLIQTIKLNQNT